MTGRMPTGLLMGVAIVLGVALAAAIALTGRVGGGGPQTASPGAQGAPATGSGLRAPDAEVLAAMRPAISDWNAAAHRWTRALEAGRAAFLRTYPAVTRRMDADSLRIRLSAAEIQDPRLQSLIRRLGDIYRQQFRAVRSANDAVVAGDPQLTAAAINRVEHADDEKTRAATALVDAYPELAGDLSRIK
jgi:hypothetical protein